jgi:hypothetical protein
MHALPGCGTDQERHRCQICPSFSFAPCGQQVADNCSSNLPVSTPERTHYLLPSRFLNQHRYRTSRFLTRRKQADGALLHSWNFLGLMATDTRATSSKSRTVSSPWRSGKGHWKRQQLCLRSGCASILWNGRRLANQRSNAAISLRLRTRAQSAGVAWYWLSRIVRSAPATIR